MRNLTSDKREIHPEKSRNQDEAAYNAMPFADDVRILAFLFTIVLLLLSQVTGEGKITYICIVDITTVLIIILRN